MRTEISVEGDRSFKPVTSFEQCGLERRLLAYLVKRGFATPTDIQAEVARSRL